MARPKNPDGKGHMSRGVSIPYELGAFADSKKVPFSTYIQALIRADMEHGIISFETRGVVKEAFKK